LLLKVDSLRVTYGNIEVLHGIDFEVTDGVTALIGPNGAGKSTTLGAISGILPISNGSIFLDGKDLTRYLAHQRVDEGLSLVPEGRHLFSHMSVEENLLAGAFSKKAREKIPETLSRVYELFPILKEKKGNLASTLSGGQQQMVAVARGLMSLPRILMLDEPSLGLAPIIVEQMFDLIGEIAAQGTPILLVEQNLMEALRLAKKAYVLEQGKVIGSGEGPELANDPHVKEAYLGL